MRVREGYHGPGAVVPVDDPTYLVEIWTQDLRYGPEEIMWECAEFELEDCDVQAALRWAEERTPVNRESRFVMYACYRETVDPESWELHVHLTGTDPTMD